VCASVRGIKLNFVIPLLSSHCYFLAFSYVHYDLCPFRVSVCEDRNQLITVVTITFDMKCKQLIVVNYHLLLDVK